MKIRKYPDGSSYVEVETINMQHGYYKDGLNNRVFRINSYEDLWHLNQMLDAYYNEYQEKPTITIPCLIDAQADRRFSSSHSHGLKLVCDLLNRMPAKFKIFHPHNPEVVEALMDNVEFIDNSAFIKAVIENIPNAKYQSKKPEFINNLILMSSDAGGYKPLMNLCNKIGWEGSTYSASKARVPCGEDGMKILQFVERKDFKGKDILIVNDICIYGGTFKGLSQILRESNCGKLYLAVSHLTVQILEDDPVVGYFDKVFTTNSKYDNYYIGPKTGYTDAPKNLEIIKMF
jgi:ribose-phosphate pyrophosphokinase